MNHFVSACAALTLLASSACAMRPDPNAEPPISERTYAEHSCADLGEAWRDMRDHEDQLSKEIEGIANGQSNPGNARPLKDRGHAQALAAVREHMAAIRSRAGNTSCALPSATTAGA